MSSGKYLANNPKLLAALRLADRFSRVLAWLTRHRDRRAVGRPQRILLSDLAHIGDVLIATAVLPPLRQAFPDVEIGILVGSWSRQAIEGHPDIAHVHVLDNVFLNRSKSSLFQGIRRHARTWLTALREIRAVGYDTAIDLYFFWPNSVPLLWAAGIPRRIGYGSGGFGSLLTDPHPWIDRERHVAESQCALLGCLGINEDAFAAPRMSIPPLPPGDRDSAPGGLRPKDYVVLHPGTGSPLREWPVANWVALARALVGDGHQLALTGRGAREAEIIATIAAAVPDAVNFCDSLAWRGFRQVVANACLVVGVESMSGHLAAAIGTPFVSIFSGITRTAWWRPLGEGAVLTTALDCAPCQRSSGCASMACMSSVSVDEVFAACCQRLNGASHG